MTYARSIILVGSISLVYFSVPTRSYHRRLCQRMFLLPTLCFRVQQVGSQRTMPNFSEDTNVRESVFIIKMGEMHRHEKICSTKGEAITHSYPFLSWSSIAGKLQQLNNAQKQQVLNPQFQLSKHAGSKGHSYKVASVVIVSG